MFDTRMRPCEFWPKGDIPASYRDPVKSDKPVLLLSGEADPVTPPAWAEETAKHLSKSRHLVVPGAGHGVSATGCVPRLIEQFLKDADPAQLDASCVQKQHRPPFFTTYSGPEAAQ
jgi:pimeloyl-ACP methyl ester carboxylesterase